MRTPAATRWHKPGVRGIDDWPGCGQGPRSDGVVTRSRRRGVIAYPKPQVHLLRARHQRLGVQRVVELVRRLEGLRVGLRAPSAAAARPRPPQTSRHHGAPTAAYLPPAQEPHHVQRLLYVRRLVPQPGEPALRVHLHELVLPAATCQRSAPVASFLCNDSLRSTLQGKQQPAAQEGDGGGRTRSSPGTASACPRRRRATRRSPRPCRRRARRGCRAGSWSRGLRRCCCCFVLVSTVFYTVPVCLSLWSGPSLEEHGEVAEGAHPAPPTSVEAIAVRSSSD